MIIPTLNEATTIEDTLKSVRLGEPHQIIIADGHSSDDTVALALKTGATIVTSEPGRARQMNAGADAATGDILLFLHADTHLPENWPATVGQTLSAPVRLGAFRLTLDDARPALKLIERAANWRSRWLKAPFGDQALFLTRETFQHVGRFPDRPIMEDMALVRQVRRHYGRRSVRTADAAVTTSARRWQAAGIWRTTLINQLCLIGFYLGVSPRRIIRWRDTTTPETPHAQATPQA
ncbi:MAG: TIGR04283 family arsenosugar biosynthesis glycosyltransferase [Phycisphaeraceae bacterium]|nr:TIGR04283 family arsenosugar biosynthesis glycosyltransferase [Phycisphaeraceae bacterium]